MEGSYRGADLAVAQWVADHGHRAGLGSDTLPAAPALYLPLSTGRETLGVLAVLPDNRRRVLLPEQRHLLETFAGQIALAVERARLAETAEGGARRRGGRELAQHAARVDLARLAHAACGNGRRRQHARDARREPRRGDAHGARALDRDEGARDVRARLERARSHAPRRGRGRAAPRARASRRARRRRAPPVRRSARGASGRGPDPERSAGPIRRRAARRAGVRQPIRQRGEVHAARHAHPGLRGERRTVRARDGRRRRARVYRRATLRNCSRSSGAASARRRSSARGSASRFAAR